MKNISPKEYVLKTFKDCDGARIAAVLKRYYAHVNFYKRPKNGETSNNLVKAAKQIFLVDN